MGTMTALAAARAAARSTPRRRRRARSSVIPYLFVTPALLCLVAFSVLPILVAGVVSLTDMDLSGLADLSNVGFVGLGNYERLFSDSGFWQALTNTALFIGLGVPAIVVLSLGIALALSRGNSRFYRALRAFYFLPSITAIVAISLIWGYLYNTQFGLLNHLLDLVGLPPVNWLSDPTTAKFSVALVAVWRAIGINTVILLAAIHGIPREYHEAASLDGAGRWRQTISITVPLLRFALFFVTVTTLIGWMQFFDEPFVLTQGGPVDATTSLSLYVFEEGFRFRDFGFASAASVVLFALIAVVTAFQLRMRGTEDE